MVLFSARDRVPPPALILIMETSKFSRGRYSFMERRSPTVIVLDFKILMKCVAHRRHFRSRNGIAINCFKYNSRTYVISKYILYVQFEIPIVSMSTAYISDD